MVATVKRRRNRRQLEVPLNPIPTMLFTVEAILPRGPDGQYRDADGVRYLSLSQCATRFGGTVETWREGWMEYFAAHLPRETQVARAS